MTTVGGVSGEHLRQYIERVERLEEEKSNISIDIREVYAEAKSNGFDPKIMRKVVRIRKMETDERQEEEAMLDVYMHALGMIPGDDSAEAA